MLSVVERPIAELNQKANRVNFSVLVFKIIDLLFHKIVGMFESLYLFCLVSVSISEVVRKSRAGI